MYTDVDFGYHSHLSTTFYLTLNYPIILTHARRRDNIEGPIQIHCSKPFNSHGNV